MGVSVVAAMVVRNERHYLANCLRHLIENEIPYVIVDNESDDGTAELLRQPAYANHLLGYAREPYPGHFDWEGLLRARQAAVDPVSADWILYVSADEIMHSYNAGETLRAAIERVDAAGHDVIDFNEFVFLPIESDYIPDHEGPQPIKHYYFFQPKRPRLMRARRKALQVSHVKHGGHVLSGEKFRLAPESFALRHYVFRSQEHALEKYATRKYPPAEVARGWHRNRHGVEAAQFRFPAVDKLESLVSFSDRELRRENPHKRHYWQW